MSENDTKERWGQALVVHRFAAIAIVDAAVWVASILCGLVLRYEFDVPAGAWNRALAVLPVIVAAQILVGRLTGMYRGRWQLGSFEEVWGLVRTVGVVGAVLVVADLAWNVVPLSLLVFTPATTLVLCAAVRYGWRLLVDRRRRPDHAALLPLLVYGAGEAGTQAVTAMLRAPLSPYLPVALVDDDPRKANLHIRGVPVRGTGEHLAAVAAETGARTVLIAIPSGDAALVRSIASRATTAGLAVRVLPSVEELVDGTVHISDIRPVTPEDLLGRRVIDTDLDSMAGYLTGKRVLITGAGGSIGSELARQVHRFAPTELVLLDRDESGLHAVQLSIEGRAMLDNENLVVADIRDRDRMAEVFERHRPEVIFHAAALKHLPLLELHPSEALKTNVWATQHLLELAEATGVERFVNISTDKAADPSSVLGRTKRITERLTAHAATRASGAYLSVRFGNVLGSRGSVLGVFRAQIEGGGPVTVTDPDVTRFFMTIDEAVELVIQAGAIGADGNVLVLDMGEPVRILDVARQLTEQSERTVDIVFTGLRPGEKLHEALIGAGEVGVPGPHPMITHVATRPLDPIALRDLDARSLATSDQSVDELIG